MSHSKYWDLTPEEEAEAEKEAKQKAEVYKNTDGYKRLLELREKFAEYTEWRQLEKRDTYFRRQFTRAAEILDREELEDE